MARIIYSLTEGRRIATKMLHKQGDSEYVRMGISFPIERIGIPDFHPEEEYISSSVLSQVLKIKSLTGDDKFLIRKADIVYGVSLGSKNIQTINNFRKPLKEGDDISLEELNYICEGLSERYPSVGLRGEIFDKKLRLFLSAATPYNMGKPDKPGIEVDILDVKTPKISLGCRVEFTLPADIYKPEKIEKEFDSIASEIGFSAGLSRLEDLHEEFLELKKSSRKRSGRRGVVKKVRI